MHEADLVRHFAALGLPGVAAIHWPRLAGGGLPAAWQDVVATSPPAILIDTLEQVHVEAIGPLLHGLADRRPTLAVGASSVAEAWFGPTVTEPDHPATGAGPTLALIGSLSPATRAQVKAASTYTVIEAQPGDLAAHHDDIVASAARVLRQGRNVMVSTAPRHGAAPDIALSGLANASATLLNAILAAAPVRRLAVAGGDTSTTAISALGFRGLSYHGLAAPGVTICRGAHPDPQRDGMLLLLKGGQMGHATLFDDFAAPGHAAEAATTDA